MIAGAKYVHTNLIARDWRALVAFYENVFGCVVVPPERDYTGDELDAGTGLSGVGLKGAHLRLRGGGDDGPTLEVFQYSEQEPEVERLVNRPGFTHIAFSVDDVSGAHAEVLANGGSAVGEIVQLTMAGGARVEWCYVTDPEGNIVELQSMAAE